MCSATFIPAENSTILYLYALIVEWTTAIVSKFIAFLKAASAKIFWNGLTSLSGPVRIQKTLQNSPIFMSRRLQPLYNSTSRYLQILRIPNYISLVVQVLYRNGKNCERFHWTILLFQPKKILPVSVFISSMVVRMINRTRRAIGLRYCARDRNGHWIRNLPILFLKMAFFS